MARSTAPVRASTLRTCCQVRPASRVRNTPRSGFSPHSRPSAATHAVLLSAGSQTTRPMHEVAARPQESHVEPPSVERYTPRPHDEELRLFASPVPTQTIEGFFCQTATAPIEATASLSNTGVQVVPRFVVL